MRHGRGPPGQEDQEKIRKSACVQDEPCMHGQLFRCFGPLTKS
ncbi:hypothetical protein SGM_0591 [Streptomyces griseoaurantiacus M045]|uniref:Uncharacterized protein n=1 Tax=Streptomyces griseoaurantiacus M045 TaxID=996637 RepID=F3NB57_9ACTN|nr:hypothetical protein SGM_0591 [Streptomyces griseoaurantiacus M045]